MEDHRVDFRAAVRFDWDSALEFVDDRIGYEETRITALGFLDGRLVAMT